MKSTLAEIVIQNIEFFGLASDSKIHPDVLLATSAFGYRPLALGSVGSLAAKCAWRNRASENVGPWPCLTLVDNDGMVEN